MHRLSATCGMLCLSFGSAPALAASGDSGALGVSAIVPQACEVQAGEFVQSENGSVSGSVLEFCNADIAYQVSASYRALGETEEVSITYGTVTEDLDHSGMALLAHRFGQRFEFVPVKIDAREISSPIAVAFNLSAV